MNDNDVRLIDANALIRNNGLENVFKCGNTAKEERDFAYSTMMMYEIKDMIDSAPTIKPAPQKQGYWEKVESGIMLHDYCFKCSCCNKTTPNKAYPVAPHYCPNCGSLNHIKKVESKRENNEENKYNDIIFKDLGLSTRAYKALYLHSGGRGYNGEELTLADVIENTPSLEKVRNCGIKTRVEIIESLKEKGISVPIWETEFNERYQSDIYFREQVDMYRKRLIRERQI